MSSPSAGQMAVQADPTATVKVPHARQPVTTAMLGALFLVAAGAWFVSPWAPGPDGFHVMTQGGVGFGGWVSLAFGGWAILAGSRMLLMGSYRLDAAGIHVVRDAGNGRRADLIPWSNVAGFSAAAGGAEVEWLPGRGADRGRTVLGSEGSAVSDGDLLALLQRHLRLRTGR